MKNRTQNISIFIVGPKTPPVEQKKGKGKKAAPGPAAAAGYNPKARVGNHGRKPPEPPKEWKERSGDDDPSVALLGLKSVYEREYLARYLQLNGDYFIKNVSCTNFEFLHEL